MKGVPRRAGTDEWAVIQMLALVALAIWVSMLPVRVTTPRVPLEPQPSPLGYTVSNLFFLLPLARLLLWLRSHPELRLQRRAAAIALGAILPLWCLLDVFLGLTFFTFPNPGATLGVNVWGWSFSQGWSRAIPVEEFVFYLTGISVILLTYMWASESWLAAYVHTDEERRAHGGRRLLHVHGGAAWVGLALFALALLWKKLGPHPHQEGFPGYFLFLLATAIVPVAMFVRVVRPFVNWQAFSFATFGLGLIFLVWEATLAMPYQYWGYQSSQMMGVFIHAWGDLPLEAALLWVAAAWLNVTTYELIRLLLANGRPLSDLLRPHRGAPHPQAPAPRELGRDVPVG